MIILIFIYLWILSLTSISAIFSIYGMAEFFAGAALSAMIMAAVLESSKIIIVISLHRYWHHIGVILRATLLLPLLGLIALTATGIFGYLSKAHIEQAAPLTEIQLRLDSVNQQLGFVANAIVPLKTQLGLMDLIIDKQVTTGAPQRANINRTAQKKERDAITAALQANTAQLQTLEQQKLEIQKQLALVNIKLGPLKYVADLLGFDAGERAVKVLIALITILFDLIALSLIVLAEKIMDLRRAGPSEPPAPQAAVAPPPDPDPYTRLPYGEPYYYSSKITTTTTIPAPEPEPEPREPVDLTKPKDAPPPPPPPPPEPDPVPPDPIQPLRTERWIDETIHGTRRLT